MSSAATQKKPPRRVIEFDEAALVRDAENSLGGTFSLDPSEIRWRDRQPELEKRGYILRPRYSPDWKPSWLGTDLHPFFCEDGIIGLNPYIMDAKRRSDGELVAIKWCHRRSHELEIARYLTTLDDDKKHCVPLLDAFVDPLDPGVTLMVMPFLRPFNSPEFGTIGEAMDFITQTIEGLAFLHGLVIAHRDIAAANIMMDARALYPEGYHPVRRNFTPDSQHRVAPLSRSDHPVRYYFIDFDLSVRFKEGESHNVIGDVGRDNEVPELSNDVPYNAFKVDIFALGNLYFKEFCKKYHDTEFLLPMIDRMKQVQPDMRPTIVEVSEQWERIHVEKGSMTSWRLSPKSETVYERAFNDTVAAARGGLKTLKSYVR